MPFSAPRTSLRNALINAVTTLFHGPALLILPSGAAVCAQHIRRLPKGEPCVPDINHFILSVPASKACFQN